MAGSISPPPKGDGPILSGTNENPTTTAEDSSGTIGPGDSHLIYGLVYALATDDEMLLDGYEGVSWAYTIEEVAITLWDTAKAVDGPEGRPVDALVYIDTLRTGHGKISAECTSRMRRGVQEAGEQGVLSQWMKDTFGKWFDTGTD